MLLRVAILSDTHGLLRPEVKADLEDVDQILHLGDVGSLEVLEEIQSLAPVVAVRGNVDKGPWAEQLPTTAIWSQGNFHLYLLHNLDELDLDPAAAGFHGVLFGHTHRPRLDYVQNILYLNPGSCGPRRFSLPISWVRMTIQDQLPTFQWKTLPWP